MSNPMDEVLDHPDPAEITDEQVDAAQEAFHQFVFGFDVPPLTHREKGITRQAWRVALQAARDA